MCRPGKSKDKIIGVIYRPPSARLSKFNEYISLILESMLVRYGNDEYYISGDFNVDLFHCNESREGLDFTTTLQSFGLFPLINRATRVGKTRATRVGKTRV